MAWRAIADDFDTHPKVRWLYDELGELRASCALALWALAQAEAGRRQARGLSPVISKSYVVRALCHDPARAAADLVAAKLWERVDVYTASTSSSAKDAVSPNGGPAHKDAPIGSVAPTSTVDAVAYAFHDDADYNPSTDPELARKKAKADRQRRWRKSKRAERARRDVDAETSTPASTRGVLSLPIPDPRSPIPIREDLNSAAAARSVTRDRARARGQGQAAAAGAPPDERERELREVLDEFAEAWHAARGERPSLTGKINLKRAGEVLRWARERANGSGPDAVRVAIRRSALRAAKSIDETARVPLAVWAANPGRFHDADPSSPEERAAERERLAARVRELDAENDRLNKNPTPKTDERMIANDREASAHRARIAELDRAANDSRADR